MTSESITQLRITGPEDTSPLFVLPTGTVTIGQQAAQEITQQFGALEQQSAAAPFCVAHN